MGDGDTVGAGVAEARGVLVEVGDGGDTGVCVGLVCWRGFRAILFQRVSLGTTTPVCVRVSKPGRAAVTNCGPAGSPSIRYSPLLPV